MKKSGFFLSLALAMAAAGLAPTASVAAPAATSSATKPDAAYYKLYDSIIGGVDLEALSRTSAGQVFDAFLRNDAQFERKAASKPGIRERFVNMCMPYFRLWMPRSMAISRERSVAALATSLTQAEARELAAFYASPLGRKIVKIAAGNISFAAQLDAEFQSGDFEDADAQAEDGEKMVDSSVRQLMRSLTPAEQREFMAFMRKPIYGKIDGMNRALASVVQPTPEEISTPEERQDFQEAVVDFLSVEFGV